MCRFDYRKYDICGDYGIVVNDFCAGALWRAGREGELRICIPEILQRSLEWSGPDEHEPPQPVCFTGYEGFCETCVDIFKLPPSIPQKSHSDYLLDYSRPSSLFNPGDMAPYVSVGGFVTRIPELLGVADQFQATRAREGPLMLFRKSLNQYTWSMLRKALPLVCKCMIEMNCTLTHSDALKRLGIQGGFTTADRDTVFYAMQGRSDLRKLYDTRFKSRGMPLSAFNHCVDRFRRAAEQFKAQKAEALQESVQRYSEISDASTLTNLTKTPELSDLEAPVLDFHSQTPETPESSTCKESHSNPKNHQMSQGFDVLEPVQDSIIAKIGTPQKKLDCKAAKPQRSTAEKSDRNRRMAIAGQEQSVPSKSDVGRLRPSMGGSESTTSLVASLDHFGINSSAAPQNTRGADKAREESEPDANMLHGPQAEIQQPNNSRQGSGSGKAPQIPYYKAERTFKWKALQGQGHDGKRKASGHSEAEDQQVRDRQNQHKQLLHSSWEPQPAHQPLLGRKSGEAQRKPSQPHQAVLVPKDSDEDAEMRTSAQDAAQPVQGLPELDSLTIQRLQNSGLLRRSRRR